MTAITALLVQDLPSNPYGVFFSGPVLAFWLVAAVLVIVGGWKMFEKAGHPGWAILIPFYNVYILLKIAGRPGWWLVFYFIPIINVVIAIVVAIDVAKAFGQSAMFGFFLIFLFCGVGYLILGFGNYRYQGALAAAATP